VGSDAVNAHDVGAAQAGQIAQELRSWCAEHGVSQSSVAMEIGVSVSHLNQVINGRARPSADLTRRMVEVLERHKARLPRLVAGHHRRALEESRYRSDADGGAMMTFAEAIQIKGRVVDIHLINGTVLDGARVKDVSPAMIQVTYKDRTRFLNPIHVVMVELG
jgi:transcriptional regulator with XRE-family HTH domain